MQNTNKKSDNAPKKPFKKPEFKQHSPISTVSGSGCSSYSSRVSGDTYYW